MKDVYSLINELQYGGINIPVQKTTIETFDQLTSDFEGYTKEELQELLKKLKESKSPFSKQAIKVIKKVPYIKSNEEELGRKLKKE